MQLKFVLFTCLFVCFFHEIASVLLHKQDVNLDLFFFLLFVLQGLQGKDGMPGWKGDKGEVGTIGIRGIKVEIYCCFGGCPVFSAL